MENRKKLNEGFQQLIGETDNTGNSDSLLMIGGGKKKKTKKSKLVIPQQQKTHQQIVAQNTDITIAKPVIPKPLSELAHEQIVSELTAKQVLDKKETKKVKAEKTIKKLGKKKELVQQEITQRVQEAESKGIVVTTQQKQQLAQEIKETIEVGQITPDDIVETKEVLEEINNVSLDNVNVTEVLENVGAALEEIPDAKNIEIEDIEITPSKVKKDKTGYFKTKVNIKKSNIPDIINKIASYVKQQSKGIIKPRVCDLRVIGNTNKTQLRNSSVKLSVNTVVFKPDANKLKVNKGTRFMISIPENHESTGNLLIYIQESRAKTILEVTPKDFPNQQTFNEFIGDRIAEYYYHGYEVTLKKLQLRGKDNPLMSIISQVLNTRDYKAKPHVDADNHLFAVDFVSNGDENQWLTVQIRETDQTGMYEIIGLNTVSGDEYQLINKNVTLQYIDNNIVTILNKSYARDWSKELSADDGLEEFYYLLSKLKHFKLRKVLVEMNNVIEEQPDLGLVIQKTASRKDMVKLQKSDYDAEAIIGKTNACDFFILTYLAYQIIGGDSRKGREYITREQYYDKYSVSDRRQYQKREKTILKKEGNERNYNARPYIFQLEYSVNGVVYIYRSKTYLDVLNATKFLTLNPNINVKSPIE